MIRSMLLKAKHDRAEGADRADLSEPAQPVPALSPDTIRLYLLLFTTNSLLYWWVYSSIPLRVEWCDEWMYERSQVTRTNAWNGRVRRCDEIDLKLFWTLIFVLANAMGWREIESREHRLSGQRVLRSQKRALRRQRRSQPRMRLREPHALLHYADAVWGRFSKAFERTSENNTATVTCTIFISFHPFSICYDSWKLVKSLFPLQFFEST